jgi:glucose/arabinose dehydrogenase
MTVFGAGEALQESSMMRFLVGSIALLGCSSVLTLALGTAAPSLPASNGNESRAKGTVPAPTFDTFQRVPWITSRVLGSPKPPLPYGVRNAFPMLKVICPIAVAHEPGTDNLLLLHQLFPWGGQGKLLRIKDDPNVSRAELVLSIDGIGYGMAFHPDFLKNGYLYIGSNGPLHGRHKTTQVTRYTVDRKPPYKLDPQSARLIIGWESDGHNGGDVAFGKDGMLYVTSGDGTGDSDTNIVGQDLSKLLSKVLRIDVDHPTPGKAYSIPPDNPFLQTPGARPETYAYGFRNPWRIHIDKPTGDIWVGQNGQDLWEQAFLVQRGANYGWSVYEGGHPFYLHRKLGPTPVSPPLVDHPHSEMRSLTGGIVYHGTRLPELRDAYIYGDWSTGRIWGIRQQRGKVIRHQELANTTLQITGFGADSRGEVLIADHGGGYYSLEPAPKDAHPAKFPTRLSETGIFTSVKGHQTHSGLIPYSVNAPLWSDGADKERFIGLPGQTQIEFTRTWGWNFPEGTVLVKTFSLLQEEGNSASRRRIETRLLTRQVGKWVGYSYIWNDEQTDAELVDEAGLDRVYGIRDPRADGGVRKQTWHYPSRTECMVCHSRAANFVLGLTEVQMNKFHDYGSVTENQLTVLARLGVLQLNTREHAAEFHHVVDRLLATFESLARLAVGDAFGKDLVSAARAKSIPLRTGSWIARHWGKARRHLLQRLDGLASRAAGDVRLARHLPRPTWAYAKLANPSDPHQGLVARARSYLHANCAQCHVGAGGGNALMELDFSTPDAKTNTIGVRPQHDTFGIADAKLIAPGHPERSILLQRMMRRGPGQMPPLATARIDQDAVQLLSDWIKQLEPVAEKTRRRN